MSISELLQNDNKSLVGPNIRLIICNLPGDYNVQKFIGLIKSVKDLDEFLSKNDNADGVIVISRETVDDKTKNQLGFYVRQYEHLPPINEYVQREEHGLNLRERGIPINQAKIKVFEQANNEASSKEILPVVEQFVKDFVPQNSS